MSDYDEIIKLKVDRSDEEKAVSQVLNDFNKINNTKIKMSIDGVSKSTNEIKSLKSAIRSLQQERQQIESISNSFKTLGNTITGLGRGIQAFSASSPLNRWAQTLTIGLTSGLTRAMTIDLDSVVKRYDTMKLFSKQMKVLGYDTTKSQQAIEKINDAIIGLPVSLDEVTAKAQKYIMLTGDLQKGTTLTMSLENLTIAGGAAENQVRSLNLQIPRLLAGAKLTSRQWQGVAYGLGNTLGFVGEKFGFARQDIAGFTNALMNNKINTQDFINALIDVGSTNEQVQELLNNIKHTLSSAMANTKIALERGVVNILNVFDEIFGGKGGNDLIDYIYKFNKKISKTFEDLATFTTKHKGDILEFFKELKKIDFKGILEGFGQGMLDKVKIYAKIVEILGSKKYGRSLSWLTSMGPVVGRGLSIFGGAISTFAGIIGRIKIRSIDKKIGNLFDTLSSGGKITQIGQSAETLTNTGTSIARSSKAWKALGLSAGIIGEIALIGGVVYEYAKVTETISKLNINSAKFKKNLEAVSDLLGNSTMKVGVTTGIFTALGAIPKYGTILQGAAGIGELLAGGQELLVAGEGKILQQYAKLAKTLSTIKLDKTKIDKSLDEVKWTMEKIDKIFGAQGWWNTLVNSLTGSHIASESESTNKILKNLLSVSNLCKKLDDVKFDDIKFENISKLMALSNKIIQLGYENFGLYQTSLGDSPATMFWGTLSNIVKIFNDKQVSSELKTVKNIVKNISTFVTELQKIDDVVDGLDLNTDLRGNGNKVFDKIRNLKNFMEELMHLFDDFQATTKFAYDEMGRDRKRYYKEGTRNSEDLQRIIEPYSNIVTSLSNVATKLIKIKSNLKGFGKKSFEGVKEKIKDVIGILGEITTLFDDEKFDDLSPSLFEEKLHPLSQSMGSLLHISEKLKPMMEELNKVELVGPTTPSIVEPGTTGSRIKTDATTKITDFVTLVSTIADQLNSIEPIDDNVTSIDKLLDQLPIMLGKITNIVNAIDTKALIGATADSAQSKIDSLFQVIRSVIRQISQGQLEGDLSGYEDKIIQLQNMVNKLKAISDTTKQIDVNTGIVSQFTQLVSTLNQAAPLLTLAEDLKTNIDDIYNYMTKLDDVSLSNISNSLSGVGLKATGTKTQVDALLKALNKINKTYTATITLDATGFSSTLFNIQNQLVAFTSKTWTVNVGVNNKASGILPGLPGNPFHSNGGFIYRAKGGSIFDRFKRGTDTVPAMLTPGEFVMSRKASQFLGAKVLNSLNQLNLSNAQRYLSNRIMQTSGNTTNNVKNIRDNHAQVVINNYSGSGNISRRTANRWAKGFA